MSVIPFRCAVCGHLTGVRPNGGIWPHIRRRLSPGVEDPFGGTVCLGRRLCRPKQFLSWKRAIDRIKDVAPKLKLGDVLGSLEHRETLRKHTECAGVRPPVEPPKPQIDEEKILYGHKNASDPYFYGVPEWLKKFFKKGS